MPKKRKNNKTKARTKPNVNGQETIHNGRKNSSSVDLTEETSIESFNSVDEHSVSHECLPQELMSSHDRNLVVGYVQTFEPHFQRTGNLTDDNLHSLCDCVIENGFNFVCYPLAGVSRATQYAIEDFLPAEDGTTKSVADLPPVHVNLSDIQLSKVQWPLNGYVSPWIDCDHPNAEFAKYSAKQLDLCELPNAVYLGYKTVVIEIRRRDNFNLIRILRKWLWQKDTNLCFWIIYPSTIGQIHGAQEGDDIWTLWADFRQQLFNYSRDKLIVGIRFNQIDQEFIDPQLFSRWRGEPLDIFWFDVEVLSQFDDFNDYNIPELAMPYLNFFANTFFTYNQRCMISNLPNGDCRSMEDCKKLLKTIRIAMSRVLQCTDFGISSYLDEIGIPFNEQFQNPLHPADDDLSCAVYRTFEKHVHKYELYGKAICHAVTDLYEAGVCSSSKPPVILVVGAGRGGIVERVFEAERQVNEIRTFSAPKKWVVLAIEKNQFAALSLETSNRQRFNNRVRVIKADARDFNTLQALIKHKADLVVSEMLGSFGDNELEPEVLEFIEKKFCHEKSILIPQKYSSYVEPIHSLRMLQSVKSRQLRYYERLYRQKQKDPDSGVMCPADKFYVVPLTHFHRIVNESKEILKCFTFVHPEKDTKFTRNATLSFQIKATCDITGFAGYFEAFLYKDIFLSTRPGTKQNDASLSWFPVYIPVRNPIRCPANSTLHFDISRCTDNIGVWYEWQQGVTLNKSIIFKSEIQNKDGKYDFMRLTQSNETDINDDEFFDSIDYKHKIVL